MSPHANLYATIVRLHLFDLVSLNQSFIGSSLLSFARGIIKIIVHQKWSGIKDQLNAFKENPNNLKLPLSRLGENS